MVRNLLEVKRGSTRTVLLTKKYAFKFPTFYSWNNFLNGLIANMNECLFYWAKMEDVCPVLFSIRGGFLVVMPRVEPMTYEEFKTFDFDSFKNREDYVIPVERKSSSFGYLNGKIVAIDYG